MDRELETLLPLKERVYLALLSLAECEKHAYALKKDIAARTNGKIRLGPGTLHRTIQGLEDDGLIEESDNRPPPELDDERRRYFRLTPRGRRLATLETDRLTAILADARRAQLGSQR